MKQARLPDPVVLFAAGLLCTTAVAQQVAGTAPPPARAAVAPTQRIEVTAYEGFAALGPLYGSRHTPLEVPVGATLVTCADGNRIVSALDIGGWNHTLDAECRDGNRRGSIRVDAGSARAGPPALPAAATPDNAAAGTRFRCDPATWRCTLPPR